MTWSHILFALIGWLAIEALIWIVRRVIAEGKAKPDLYEHTDAEGR